jgi:hypothetical protein
VGGGGGGVNSQVSNINIFRLWKNGGILLTYLVTPSPPTPLTLKGKIF